MGKKSNQEKRARMESDDSLNSTMNNSVELSQNSAEVEKILERVFASDRFSNMAKQISWQEERIKALEEENKKLRQKLAIVEGSVTRNEINTTKINDKVIYMTSRSMRDNVIIKNLDEPLNETEDDLEIKAMNIFKDLLKIKQNDLQKIQIARIHRIGKPMTGKKRNVVARLTTRGKQIVIQNLKNIPRDSTVRVTEQLPPEIHAKREKLWPMFVEAKRKGQRTKWKHDSLEIDGRLHKHNEDRNADINLDTTEVAMTMSVKHTPILTRDNNHFQGHVVNISSKDDVVPALKALRADTRVAGASSCIYAYRIGTEQTNIHNWEDDTEWSGGRYVMEGITRHNIYNKLICITQWCGLRRLGPFRLDIIRELTKTAIEME